MTGNEEEAADLTQQAFCKAITNWDTFNNRSRATTWLHRILVNCVKDHARRRALRNAEPLDEWALVEAGNGDGHAIERLHRNEQLEHLRRTIEDLSGTLREAFVVTIIDGYTYQEASELLDVPVGTIASRVNAARKQVNALMQRAYPEP